MFIIKAKKKKNDLLNKIMLLSKIRTELINDRIAKDICKENNVDEDFLFGVCIKFDDLDVSAKTVDSEIILNNKLIEKSFDIVMRYVIHELVHAIQHCENGGKNKKNNKSKDYLDNPDEVDAFKKQVLYQAENNGNDSAKKYVDGLLEYHDIDGDEKKEKEKELMEEVD